MFYKYWYKYTFHGAYKTIKPQYIISKQHNQQAFLSMADGIVSIVLDIAQYPKSSGHEISPDSISLTVLRRS